MIARGSRVARVARGRARQKASAQLKPIHPPTVIAKLCSSAFKKSTRRILENVRENYAVPPGTQPDAMVSDDLRVGMKRAAADISRSKFEVYNFSTRHDLSEAATDELLQMLSNVGNILVVLSKVFVFSLACLDGLDSKLLPIVVGRNLLMGLVSKCKYHDYQLLQIILISLPVIT